MRISDWSSDVCSSDLPGLPSAPRRSTAASQWCWRTWTRSSATPSGQVEGGDDLVLQRAHLGRGAGARAWDVDADFALVAARLAAPHHHAVGRSEEHTSELQSLMRPSYDAFCLKNNITIHQSQQSYNQTII